MPPAGNPPPPDPNAALVARLTAEAAVATAQAAKINAEAARDKASIQALGLPSFEGKTTLNQGAGAIEALILATEAVSDAADRIAEVALALRHPNGARYSGNFLILAGDETLDFELAAAIGAEIEAFRAIFETARPQLARSPKALAAGIAGPVAAISAIAGLLRTETEITAVDHSAISHRVLAIAVAGRLQRRAILPGAATAGLPPSDTLIGDLTDLGGRRDEVATVAKGLPAEEGERLKAALARFDAFYARVTAPDAAGRVPLVQAARLKQLISQRPNPLVLRIHVERAGGSLIQLKNIRTLFGGDPVRVSGGLVASYAITDPTNGCVLAAAVLNCRTAIGKLREIQAGTLPRGPGLIRTTAPGGIIRGRDGRHAPTLSSRANLAASIGEANMATLRIEAALGDGLQHYEFQLDDDQNNLPMGAENACTVEVAGACGDGSIHHLYYAIHGQIGARLGLKIFCDDVLKVDIPLEIFGPAVVENGDVEFEL